MGAWGVRAFDNDSALDAVELLADRDGALTALDLLLRCYELDEWPGSSVDTIANGYAACEVVAAARAGKRYFQSVGTTLLSNRNEWQQVVPYIPDEISEFLQTGPVFTDDEANLALRVLDVVAELDRSEGWSDIDKRLEAIGETRARLTATL